MQVAAADDAFEVVRHKKEEEEPTLANSARVGHQTVALVNASVISYAGIVR